MIFNQKVAASGKVRRVIYQILQKLLGTKKLKTFFDVALVLLVQLTSTLLQSRDLP